MAASPGGLCSALGSPLPSWPCRCAQHSCSSWYRSWCSSFQRVNFSEVSVASSSSCSRACSSASFACQGKKVVFWGGHARTGVGPRAGGSHLERALQGPHGVHFLVDVGVLVAPDEGPAALLLRQEALPPDEGHPPLLQALHQALQVLLAGLWVSRRAPELGAALKPCGVAPACENTPHPKGGPGLRPKWG